MNRSWEIVYNPLNTCQVAPLQISYARLALDCLPSSFSWSISLALETKRYRPESQERMKPRSAVEASWPESSLRESVSQVPCMPLEGMRTHSLFLSDLRETTVVSNQTVVVYQSTHRNE